MGNGDDADAGAFLEYLRDYDQDLDLDDVMHNVQDSGEGESTIRLWAPCPDCDGSLWARVTIMEEGRRWMKLVFTALIRVSCGDCSLEVNLYGAAEKMGDRVTMSRLVASPVLLSELDEGIADGEYPPPWGPEPPLQLWPPTGEPIARNPCAGKTFSVGSYVRSTAPRSGGS